MLAGLPQAPSIYNPLLNPKAATVRRNQVLKSMAELDYITPAEAERRTRRASGSSQPTASARSASRSSSTSSSNS